MSLKKFVWLEIGHLAYTCARDLKLGTHLGRVNWNIFLTWTLSFELENELQVYPYLHWGLLNQKLSTGQNIYWLNLGLEHDLRLSKLYLCSWHVRLHSNSYSFCSDLQLELVQVLNGLTWNWTFTYSRTIPAVGLVYPKNVLI